MTVALALAANAAAAPTEADRTTARELAREGYEALQQKNYAVAEDRFRRADALVHAPTIVVDHARALVGLGRFVEAYERYALVLREGVPSDAPASWKQALADAEREIAAVKPRLAWLVINVEGPTDPVVSVDGREVPNASLGARRAADPGKRKVRVTADGFASGGRVIVLKEGEEQSITITLERAPSVELEETPEPVEQVPEPEQAPSILPYVAFGVGGVGLAVGGITGSMSLGARSDLAESCTNGRCVPKDRADQQRLEDLRSEYHLFGTISGIGFGLGIAGVATGVVLLLTAPGSDANQRAGAVVPLVGPNFVGVRGSL